MWEFFLVIVNVKLLTARYCRNIRNVLGGLPVRIKKDKNMGRGRPRGSGTEAGKLRRALRRVEKRRGIDFYERFVEMALDNSAIMINLMKKLIPDAKPQESVPEQPDTHAGVIVVLPDNGRGDLFPEEPLDRGYHQ